MPGRLFLFLFVLLTGPAVSLAEQPAYLTEALEHFSPNLPPDWAYTVKTTRGGETSIEHFDPAQSPESQWTLLRLNDRPATVEEAARYTSYRIATSRSSQPTFLRSDIDVTSLKLLREDEGRAVYAARFRAGLDDPLLTKLSLQITVAKSTAHIESFALELTEPHSPVLTVKMLVLRVETTLTPPAGGQPALPAHIISRFRGRVFFFKNIEEDVDSVFSDFAHVPRSPTSPPLAGP